MADKEVKRITHFNFKESMLSGMPAHVALVDEGANGQEVLIMKNKQNKDLLKEADVTVSLSMKEFLRKFFDLWSDDAEVLARALGYENNSEEDEYEDTYEGYIQRRVDQISITKSSEIPEKISANLHQDLEKLKETFEENINEVLKHKEDEKMSKELQAEIEALKKQLAEKDSEAELAKAKELAEAELASQLEELQKAKESELAELAKAKEAAEAELTKFREEALAKAKEETLDLVKGYSFISEDMQENLVSELLKKNDSSAILLQTLEKAKDALDAALTKELGEDLDDSKQDLEKSVETEQSTAYRDAFKAALAKHKKA